MSVALLVVSAFGVLIALVTMAVGIDRRMRRPARQPVAWWTPPPPRRHARVRRPVSAGRVPTGWQ
jgi:hypothetical protein